MKMTSFRLREDISNDLDILKKTTNTTLQDIMRKALTNYLDKELNTEHSAVELLKSDTNLKEHILIPISYYLLLNNVERAIVMNKINTHQLKSITINDSILILVDISENIYKKAELMSIQESISNLTKDYREMKNELNALRREIKSIKPNSK